MLADQWNSKGRHFSGIVYAHQLRVTVGQIIADLQLIVKAVTMEEIRNAVLFYQFEELLRFAIKPLQSTTLIELLPSRNLNPALLLRASNFLAAMDQPGTPVNPTPTLFAVPCRARIQGMSSHGRKRNARCRRAASHMLNTSDAATTDQQARMTTGQRL